MKLPRSCFGACLFILCSAISLIAQIIPYRPELILQSGHAGGAERIVLSDDGKLLASCAKDHTALIWDVTNGRVLRSLSTNMDECSNLSFSPNNQLLALAGRIDANTHKQKGEIELWDLATGKQMFPSWQEYADKTLVFSPDGRFLFTGNGHDESLSKWDLANGKNVGAIETGAASPSARFTSDGRLLAAGPAYGDPDSQSILVSEPLSNRPPQKVPAPPGNLAGIALSVDGQLVALANDKGQVQYTNLATHKTVVIRNPSATDDWYFREVNLIFSPNGKSILIDAELWDIAEAKKLNKFAFYGQAVFNGKIVASGGRINLWDAGTYERIRTLDLNDSSPVTFLAFNKGGTLLVSGSGNYRINELRAWNVGASGTCLTLFPFSDAKTSHSGDSIESTGANYSEDRLIAVTPTGRIIATASRNEKNIDLWDAPSGAHISTIDSPPVTALAFSSEGKILVSGHTGKLVHFWDVKTGEPARKPLMLKVYVAAIALDSTSEKLAIGSEKGIVHLLNAGTGDEIRTLEGFTAASSTEDWNHGEDDEYPGINLNPMELPMASVTDSSASRPQVKLDDPITNLSFSPDGKYLATAGDFGTQVWDLSSGEIVHIFKRPPDYSFLRNENEFNFTTDSKTLANAGGETILFHDLDSMKRAHVIKGNTGGVNAFAFSPNGKLLATGGQDETIRILDLTTGEEVARLIAFNKRDWLVVSPDGLFDGPPGSWAKVFWRFSDNLYDIAPVEAYFHEFYRPGLLSAILSGEKPKATQDLRSKDRRQPTVGIELVRPNDSSDRLIDTRSVRVRVKVAEARAANGLPASGVRDVRLFRNDALVKLWPGDIPLDANGEATLDTDVTAVSGENTFSAYAFNHDNVKSLDYRTTRMGDARLFRKGTAYIIAAGISSYQNSAFNLKYVADDAREFGKELSQQQLAAGEFADVRLVVLTDQQVTRANILFALKRLAGEATGDLPPDVPPELSKLEAARPEDAVFLFFSGHGATRDERFYLIPYDLKYEGARELTESNLRTVLSNSISDLELAAAIRDIDTGKFLLIIDACHSGQALAGETNGPINSSGLAQLVYEKGMYVLAASQNIEEAFVSTKLHQSYLTFVLVQEGLKQGAADTSPPDGRVDLREWFDFASARVPTLREENLQAKEMVEVTVATSPTQTPRAFYRRDADDRPLVIGVAPNTALKAITSKTDTKIYRVDELAQPARIISMSSPGYTDEAREKEIEGTVRLRAVLMSNGQVGEIEVFAGLPSGLTEKAIEAVRAIKFIPARLNGKPVSQYQTIEFAFRLY